MSIMSIILFGFASIMRLLTMKPKNFPAETLKAQLIGFHFILQSFRIWNDSARRSTCSLALTNITNMSSMYTSMDAPICF